MGGRIQIDMRFQLRFSPIPSEVLTASCGSRSTPRREPGVCPHPKIPGVLRIHDPYATYLSTAALENEIDWRSAALSRSVAKESCVEQKTALRRLFASTGGGLTQVGVTGYARITGVSESSDREQEHRIVRSVSFFTPCS